MEYQSQELNEIASALAKAQGDMSPAKADGTNPHFKSSYATLHSVIDAVKEPLSKNGLAYTQRQVLLEGQTYLETRIIHTSGQWMCSYIPIDMQMIRNTKSNAIQQYGSLMTYLRRYALMSIAGIASDDDDGNGNLTDSVPSQVQSIQEKKINSDQVKWFADSLEFHGAEVKKRFWEGLKKSNKYKLEDIPAVWYEQIKNSLLNIVTEMESTTK